MESMSSCIVVTDCLVCVPLSWRVLNQAPCVAKWVDELGMRGHWKPGRTP